MNVPKGEQRAFLVRVARRAMVEHGLEPDFTPAALAEAQRVEASRNGAGPEVRDLRKLLWCSIDNIESRDLDQLTVAEALPDDAIRMLVAIADVSASVSKSSAIDAHARANTTSVYTPPQIFPMLPDELSTDLTSLVASQDRLAVVIETVIDGEGVTRTSDIYRALVHNHAKLAYPSVGPWLEQNGPMPPGITEVSGLAENLAIQDRAAQRIKGRRQEEGALEFETLEPRARFDGDAVTELVAERRNRAKELIENFMIASNGTTARYLEAHRFPVVRRVVRTPARWDRIVDIAEEYGKELPAEPDPRALNAFLLERQTADPLRFPDLSLTIIKLLGNGEYVASFPGETPDGHFGLAVREYTHSTAPNRRYPDLITQRLLHAAMAKSEVPYERNELTALAATCTEKEDEAQKVERLMRKATAAVLLSDQIGREFDGVVTGASEKGTWARILDPPVDGRIEQGSKGLDVGDRVRVKLVHTNPERGFIDFVRVGHTPVGKRARR